MTNHPITPPPELVQQWVAEIWHEGTPVRVSLSDEHIATRAAQWGADQELEACCEILRGEFNYHHIAEPLRAARRPKPPSLAEQALKALQDQIDTSFKLSSKAQERVDLICAALERLQELENNDN